MAMTVWRGTRASVFLLALTAMRGSAWGQRRAILAGDCVRGVREGGGRRSGATVGTPVSLDQEIEVGEGCAARLPGGDWRGLAPGWRSFLQLAAEAGQAPRGGGWSREAVPYVLELARCGRSSPRGAEGLRCARIQRLNLSSCVRWLGVESVLLAEVAGSQDGGARASLPIRLRRRHEEVCRGEVRVGTTILAGDGRELVTDAGQPLEVSIGLTGGDASAPRLLLGTISARVVRTELQRRFDTARVRGEGEASPLWTLRAPGGLWGLAPHESLGAVAVDELQVAADAGWLTLSRGDSSRGDSSRGDSSRGDSSRGDSSRGGIVFEGEGRSALGRVPDALFAEALAARFGEPGTALAPTASEAREALAQAKACLPGRYEAGSAQTCVDFLHTISSDLSALGRDSIERTLRLERTLWRVTARGPEARGPEATERARVGGVEGPALLPWVASVGDRIAIEGDARGLFVCDEQGCGSLAARATVALARPGLHELREAPDPERARTASARTLARWVVIDPWGGWAPVGLWGEADEGRAPWAQVARDDEGTFAFERRVHAMTSRLSVSARSVAVWSRARAEGATTSVLSGDVGLIASDARAAGAPSASALVLVLSREESCPEASARAVRAGALIEPDALPPGSVFHVLLAQDRGPERPLACLATARLRVRPRRALAAAGPVVLGVLGDPRLAWLSPWDHGGALAVMVPAVYLRATAGPWLATELSLVGSMGFAPVRVAIDALGPAAVLDARAGVVTAGVAMFAPRWSSDRAPQFNISPFVSLDVGALYELAGGR
jgi:hypothetical protein